ncbi:Endonuclease/exonuclease/phosphatase, partial [Coprinopsis sp. MPI-PUGE-AT-0042]
MGMEEQSPPRQQTRSSKNSRAALRFASLNIRGGGSDSTRNKWERINQILRDERIDVLAVQETHITNDVAEDLEERYPRLHIVLSPHPTDPTSRGGVAFVVNKYTTNWAESTSQDLLPGRALLLTMKSKIGTPTNVLAIYAPSGDAIMNRHFWIELDELWSDNPTLPMLDMMLGDMNMVETSLDRYPARSDNGAMITALEAFKARHELEDGWRLENPTGVDFTFSTGRNTMLSSRSRIDRIYVTSSQLDMARWWMIQHTGIQTDHQLVSVQLAPPSAPEIGKGRSTFPIAVLSHKQDIVKLLDVAADFERQLESLKPEERSEEHNPQTLWRSFKTQL